MKRTASQEDARPRGRVLLIDNYDSFTYNLHQCLLELGARVVVKRNDSLSAEEALALGPEAVVVSPGPGRPEEAGALLGILRLCAPAIPVLGVCLGHQALAQAFGGRVVRARTLMHGKVSRVLHDGKGVYRGLPHPLEAARYHSLCVERESLPPCFKVSAWAEDGTLMGIRHRRWRAEGVQFHPESIATPAGKALLRNFLASSRSAR
ncbi:MAG: aminodeoxychorismate/anthranilate synthase component II [Elusimicrobiota bacterium]